MQLLERDSEIARLRSAAGEAQLGRGLAVVVSGEAGIGKTALVRSAFEQPHLPANMRLLWGGCEALFSARPLGPIYDVAPSLGPQVGEAMLAGHNGGLFPLILESLRQGRGTVLVLDDLHWADDATLDFVKYLGRRVAALPVLLVVLFRDDELGERHPLRTVLGDLAPESVLRMKLAGLSETAVETLARTARVSRAGLHALTQGNPFFVTECLRAVDPPDGVPGTVRDAVMARVARQTPPVRALLELVCISPGRIEAALVDSLLSPRPDDVQVALESGLLVAQGRTYAFRHELARSAVELSLPAPRARDLHSRVLAHLMEQPVEGIPRARCVHHAAGAHNDRAVFELAPLAAREAASQGAHRQAAALFEAALGTPLSVERAVRADLLDRHAYECYLAGEPARAMKSQQQALVLWSELGEAARQCHTVTWLSRLNWVLGRRAEAVLLADQAIALGRRGNAIRELGWALANRAHLHLMAAQFAETAALCHEAIDVAGQVQDPALESHAGSWLGIALHECGDDSAASVFQRSIEIALQHDLPEHVVRAQTNLLYAAMRDRDYARVDACALQIRTYLSARDLAFAADYVNAVMCRVDLERCRWDDVGAAAAALLRREELPMVTKHLALAAAARLRMRRGEPGAIPLLEEATAWAESNFELARLAPVGIAHAEGLWMQMPGARLDLVLTTFAEAVDKRDRRTAGELALWLHLLGQPPDVPDDLLPQPVRLLRAGQWQQAAQEWRALECHFEGALTLLASDDARAMQDALSKMVGLNVPASAARCRAILKSRGIKLPSGSARQVSLSKPRDPAGAHPQDQLTSRELQILGLIARGASNKEIASSLYLSTHTVKRHMANILGKLGAASRGQAAAMYRERGAEARQAFPSHD